MRTLLSIACYLCATFVLKAIEFDKDVVYKKVGKRELKLDITYSKSAKMRPLVMCIHGGGWMGGHRSSYHSRMRKLAEEGYVAATLEYRFAPKTIWPGQMEDIQAAHQFLVKNAERFGIDPERIAAWGESAGGHLSLLLGMMPKEQKESLRLRGVVNYFGPTEFRQTDRIQGAGRFMLMALMGGRLDNKKEILAQASPMFHVGRTDPPVLTLHGTKDQLVPIEGSELLHENMMKAQIPGQLFKMEGAGHGMGGDRKKGQELLRNFFEDYLRGSDMELLAHEDFDKGVSRWEPTDSKAWKTVIKDGRTFYSLHAKSDYKTKVRSPFNISLLKGSEVGDFVLDVDLRSTIKAYGHQDLCLFFGHQGPEHYYYVHLGRKADAHANSIFLVNNAPRVSIAKTRTEGTDWSRGWHRARVKREVASGKIEVFFDDMQKPVMTTVDKTFTHGRVGIGSFDDTGDFDAIRLWGKRSSSK